LQNIFLTNTTANLVNNNSVIVSTGSEDNKQFSAAGAANYSVVNGAAQ
jgi:hypothetical protein